VTLALLLWLAITAAIAAVLICLLIPGGLGFVRGVREGMHGLAPQPIGLRSILYRTVLVALLVPFLLWTALLEHDQQDQQYPVSEGMVRLRDAESAGAITIDDRATAAIEAALRSGVGGNPGSSGPLQLKPAQGGLNPLPDSVVSVLRRRGWVVGAGRIDGQLEHFVAWKTSKTEAVFYGWGTPPWWIGWVQQLVTAAVGVVVLSPFAAAAAWLLNRRIVKPVRRVAEASVVLAEGGEPMPVPTKAPRELSVLAASFNELAARLRRAQETEHDFLLSVGHELKTPLTAIDGYTELLADGAVEPGQAAEVLALESSRLRRLIGDLLDMARIGRSQFSVIDEPVDLAAIAGDVRSRFESLATTLGVALRIEALAPAEARGDGGRLLQVASNLVENALRVTPSGGSVGVSVRPGLLEVSDTGPGLSDEDLEHAFERFYLHRKYSGPDVGTGLGLAIVKELAEAMSGSVEVVSQAGVGSTFRVHLRAADADLAASPAVW
jgi:signal transduction histidine kinase